jgi:hypothetical protein
MRLIINSIIFVICVVDGGINNAHVERNYQLASYWFLFAHAGFQDQLN